MPSVLPVQAISHGWSTRRIVDVTVPGPAFQRNTDPSATSPSAETDLTSAFQLGHPSNAVSTSQTSCGGASISIWLAPTTGAPSLIPAGRGRADAYALWKPSGVRGPYPSAR